MNNYNNYQMNLKNKFQFYKINQNNKKMNQN